MEKDKILWCEEPAKIVFLYWAIKFLIYFLSGIIAYLCLSYMRPEIASTFSLQYIIESMVLPYITTVIYFSLTRKTYRYSINYQAVNFEDYIHDKQVESIPYDKIISVTKSQDIIQRIFGISDIHIKTIDTTRQHSLIGLKNAEWVKNIIMEIIRLKTTEIERITLKKRILWSKKPSNKFILYYSFLNFDITSYRGHAIENIKNVKNIPLPFTIILLVIVIAPLLSYSYSVFIANEKPHVYWNVALASSLILSSILFIFALYNTLLRKSSFYAITERGVEFTGGVFTKVSKEVPFSKIVNVEIKQKFLERLVGIYEVHIKTFGFKLSSEPMTEISFLGIEDPYTPRGIILQYIRKFKSI